jgi:SAM-dependent methyltransferase
VCLKKAIYINGVDDMLKWFDRWWFYHDGYHNYDFFASDIWPKGYLVDVCDHCGEIKEIPKNLYEGGIVQVGLCKCMKNYWDIEHAENWHKGIDGSIQTAMLCGQVLGSLSIRQYEKLMDADNLIDVGCGTGEAAAIFDGFLDGNIFAVDYCEKALSQLSYSIIKLCSDFRNLGNKYDVVYCSQMLAFYKEDLLSDLANLAKKMIIIVVPYDQNMDGRITEPADGNEPGGHKRAFSRKDFPKFLDNFERTTFKPMPITNQRVLGSQLLVVYELIDDKTKKDIEFDQKQLDDYYEHLENR